MWPSCVQSVRSVDKFRLHICKSVPKITLHCDVWIGLNSYLPEIKEVIKFIAVLPCQKTWREILLEYTRLPNTIFAVIDLHEHLLRISVNSSKDNLTKDITLRRVRRHSYPCISLNIQQKKKKSWCLYISLKNILLSYINLFARQFIYFRKSIRTKIKNHLHIYCKNLKYV